MKNAVKKFLIIALMAVVTLTLSGVAISSAEVREKALNTAIEQAGVNAEEIFDVEVEIEKKNGVVIIEVEFQTEGKEYEYHINKATGEVISSTIKNDDYRPGSNNTTESGENIITKVDALDIALADAGLRGKDVKDIEIDLDDDDGVLHYEVEFERKATSEKTEYEYEIDAYTGEIISKKVDDKPAAPSSTPAVPTVPTEKPEAPVEPEVPQIITRDEALNIALTDAGLTIADIRELEVELDEDDGILSYEIQFERIADNVKTEYEYDIDAKTGEIITKEVDEESSAPAVAPNESSGTTAPAAPSEPQNPAAGPDVKPTQPERPEAPQVLTRDEALAIVLKDSGVNEADVRKLEIELDRDDGFTVYEVEFKTYTNDVETEYEYDIDAYTGEILKKEIDIDD